MFLTREEWLDRNKVSVEKENKLLARCYDTIMSNVSETEGLPWSPLRGIYPGNGFSGIWNWDTAFHAMCVSRWDTDLAEECILAFLRFQEEGGKLPDVILKDGEIASISSKPPVMATYALLTYERGGNLEFLTECYDRLVKNELFWRKNRMNSGLFFYDAETDDQEERDLYARYESGWDNSVRWDNDICALYPIDLQCYMIMTYRALASTANILGRSDTEWRKREAELCSLVNELFYDEEAGIYTDIFKADKTYSRIYSPASFMPLYIGIVSRERAEKMADFAKKHFLPAMPTVAYDDPNHSVDYWRGLTWINVAYFAMKGLKQYGFDSICDEIKETLLEFADKNRDGIYENYDSKTGKGYNCDGFSWSSAFFIEMILNC